MDDDERADGIRHRYASLRPALDERQRRLWEHVKALPERCRQLLSVIAFADRPDYARLAEALGMPVGSIGPTRGRCLAKLRDVLTGDPRWGEGLAT